MVDYSISKAYYTFSPKKTSSFMKKFFTTLLALVGMVAGFTLTSCGGGGGGDEDENLSGVSFSFGSTVGYNMEFGDRAPETNDYKILMTSGSGEDMEASLFQVSGAAPNTFALSIEGWDSSDSAALVTILTGVGKDKVGTLDFGSGYLTFNLKRSGADERNNSYMITWTIPSGAFYTLESAPSNKIYFNVDPDSDPKGGPLYEPVDVIHYGHKNP